jgi:hypothetical protein
MHPALPENYELRTGDANPTIVTLFVQDIEFDHAVGAQDSRGRADAKGRGKDGGQGEGPAVSATHATRIGGLAASLIGYCPTLSWLHVRHRRRCWFDVGPLARPGPSQIVPLPGAGATDATGVRRE